MALQAGPKKRAEQTKLPFNPRCTGADRFAAFCERFIKVPSGFGVGKPMRLRPFQMDIMRAILDPDPRPSIAGIMANRGSGKTALLAAFVLYELYTGPDGNHIVSVVTDERQAQLVHKAASRMVELCPELAKRAQLFRESIKLPGKGSTYTALPAEPKRLEGLGQFTTAVVDEIGVVARETWETILLGLGKAPNATVVAIGTPAASRDSVLLDLREYGLTHPDDPGFAWIEHSAAGFEDHPVDCRHCWELAAPAMFGPDPFVSETAMRALLPPRTTEAAFRRSRLCQFVSSENPNPFVPADVWQGLSTGQPVPDGADVVIALDGSWGGKDSDATALIIGTVSATPHFDVLGCWENDGTAEYRVPVLEVEQTIRDACKRWRVKELVADPFRWGRSLQVLAAEGIKVVEFPQSPSRLTRATTDLYSAAVNGNMSHSGAETLTRHMLAATVIESDGGLRIGKTSRKRSAAKVDLAVSLMMCHSRCVWLGTKKKNRTVAFA